MTTSNQNSTIMAPKFIVKLNPQQVQILLSFVYSCDWHLVVNKYFAVSSVPVIDKLKI